MYFNALPHHLSVGTEEKHTKTDQDNQYAGLESNLRPEEILRGKRKGRKSSICDYRSIKLNALQFGHDVTEITTSRPYL
jgi:hypothetical protein